MRSRVSYASGVYLILGLLLFALLALILVLRSSESVVPWLLPAVTYLPYLMAGYPLVLLLLVLSLRRNRPLPAVLFLLIWAGVALATYWPLISPQKSPCADNLFRVATWNIFRCRLGRAKVEQTIGGMGADILAVQEVLSSGGEPESSLQISEILTSLDYSSHFVGYRAGKPGPQVGIAVCVREPVRLISTQRRTYHPTGKWRYVFAEVEVHGKVINVVVPHLYPFAIETTLRRSRWNLRNMVAGATDRVLKATRWHLQEADELVRLVSTFKDPTIVLGDFNSAPDHPIHHKLRGMMTDCLSAAGKGLSPTYLFFLPLRIDYIYVTRSICVHSAQVIDSEASDHKPVEAVLSLSGS